MSCIEATSPSPRPKGFEHELRHTRALAWAWSWLVQLQTTCWKMHYVALKHAPNNRGWCSNVLKLYMSKVVTVDRRQGEDMIRLEVNLLWERERARKANMLCCVRLFVHRNTIYGWQCALSSLLEERLNGTCRNIEKLMVNKNMVETANHHKHKSHVDRSVANWDSSMHTAYIKKRMSHTDIKMRIHLQTHKLSATVFVSFHAK